jgi:NADH:ubiquinone oxidoreductase subunit F (NADH-binding)
LKAADAQGQAALPCVWFWETTVINNVKLANIQYIVRRGADWYSSFGTESKGIKGLALTGIKTQD